VTHPIADLTFWDLGEPGAPEIDAVLADPTTPLAKHGLTGLAAAYAEATGALLHETHRWWATEMAMKSLAVDGAVTEVVPALRAAGVPFFVAKGPTIAYETYEFARLRPYSDLDVYVPTEALADARQALNALEFHLVAQRRGQLGGVGRELHGGRFGTVVEVHDSVIDNVHRRYLPPISSYLGHVEHRTILGIDVPVLHRSAHLALQAVHLAAGHRYAKAILFRDIAALLPDAQPAVIDELGARRYLETARGVLATMSEPTAERRALPGGILQRRLAAALGAADPVSWDEHRASATNALALLDHQGTRHKVTAAIAGLRALLPARGRRVVIARRAGGT
jgi:hypothetical protein